MPGFIKRTTEEVPSSPVPLGITQKGFATSKWALKALRDGIAINHRLHAMMFDFESSVEAIEEKSVATYSGWR